jgi:hypothetical protein
LQQRLSIGLAATGLALVAMMVTTEGEPGALPLGLLLLGVLGWASGHWRGRRGRRR